MASGTVSVSVLTPAGRGAVATVAVVGDRAADAIGRFFRAASGRSCGDLPLERIAYGRWRDAAVGRLGRSQCELPLGPESTQNCSKPPVNDVGRPGRSQCELPLGPESTRNCSKPPVNDVGRPGRSQCELPLGPESTQNCSKPPVDDVGTEEVVVCRRRPDVFEVHCHGGTVAARRLVDGLVAAGCHEVEWQELMWPWDEHPLSAEAPGTLARARTERTAAVLLDQCRGALADGIRAALAALQDGRTTAAADRLRGLLRFRGVGQHLTAPWHVVVAGAANVGKSSLVNALLGYQRSLVFSEPGTTRDVVAASTAVDGWPVELADTAGLRDPQDAIESAGVALARQRLAAADAVVLVFDRTRAWTAADGALLAEWPQAVVVHSKSDLPPALADNRPPGLYTSAVTGQGIDQLVGVIAARVVPDPPPARAAVPFTVRQIDSLQTALGAVTAEDSSGAIAALLQLLGQPAR
jgi:tRNA modification GTPase